MTPVQPTDGGSAVLAPSSPSHLTYSSSQAPSEGVGGGDSQLDRLEAEAKVLRQQALSTQASIQQLELVEPGGVAAKVQFGRPGPWGGQGAMVVIAAMLLAGLFWWYWSRRSPARVLPQNSGFVDSSYFPLDEQDSETVVSRRLADRSPERGVPPDVESGLESAIGQDATSSYLGSVSEQGLSTDSPNLYGYEDFEDPYQAVRRSDTFDPEVAASEVERVRKFLAEKRADRTKQRLHDADRGLNSPHASVVAQAQLGGDIFAHYRDEPAPDSVFGNLQQFQNLAATKSELESKRAEQEFAEAVLPPQDAPDLAEESRRLALELWESGGHAIVADPEFLLNVSAPDWALSIDDLDLGVTDPFELSAADAESLENVRSLSSDTEFQHELQVDDGLTPSEEDELDPAVQLELAQEFESLGLFLGARKLVNEVLACGNAQYRLQAQVLLARLDELEVAQQQGLLPPMAGQDDRMP